MNKDILRENFFLQRIFTQRFNKSPQIFVAVTWMASMAHLMSCALGVTPPTAKLTLRRVSYIVHVAKIHLRCKYMSFILVEKVPFVKMICKQNRTLNTLFQQNTKFSKKIVKMMLRLVFEKSQIEKLKTNLKKLYLLITTYWSYKITSFSFI